MWQKACGAVLALMSSRPTGTMDVLQTSLQVRDALYSIRQVDLLKWLVSVRAIYYMNSIKKHTIYFMKYAHTGRE